MSIPIPSEHEEQVMLMLHVHYQLPGIEDYLFAIPNGGLRNKTVAAKLKREGVKKGIPDLFLALPRGLYHGLFIEMKRQRGGKVEPEQKEKIKIFRSKGYAAEICRGADEGLETIMNYLRSGDDG